MWRGKNQFACIWDLWNKVHEQVMRAIPCHACSLSPSSSRRRQAPTPRHASAPNQAPTPQPVRQAPMPQRDRQAPTPQSARRDSTPLPARWASTPQPTCPAPMPRPARQAHPGGTPGGAPKGGGTVTPAPALTLCPSLRTPVTIITRSCAILDSPGHYFVDLTPLSAPHFVPCVSIDVVIFPLHFATTLEECLGSLSIWKTHLRPSFNFLTDVLRCCFIIST
uniref:Uncharacterized protein n=1 Tax=Hucho hucho TaxID=62062 RepID=A0A4W5PI58_9TELE